MTVYTIGGFEGTGKIEIELDDATGRVGQLTFSNTARESCEISLGGRAFTSNPNRTETFTGNLRPLITRKGNRLITGITVRYLRGVS